MVKSASEIGISNTIRTMISELEIDSSGVGVSVRTGALVTAVVLA